MSTRVIVLAAGKGTRMGADVPKPLVEVAGRPMLDHLLDSIQESEIDNRPILIVSPDAVDRFDEICRSQSCEYVVQAEQLGTAHAVQMAEEACNGADSVIVLYGDHPFISAEIIQEIDALHAQSDGAMTMLTTTVPNFKGEYSGFERWGRIIRDDVGKILGIREAKDSSEEELAVKEVNPSIFAFNAQWLWDHIREIENQNASNEYYLTDLVAMAIEEGEEVVTSSAKPFEVVGINTPEELERAEKYFA